MQVILGEVYRGVGGLLYPGWWLKVDVIECLYLILDHRQGVSIFGAYQGAFHVPGKHHMVYRYHKEDFKNVLE